MFELRYMGTITGVSDIDPVRWPNSHWRSVKVFLSILIKIRLFFFMHCVIMAHFLLSHSTFPSTFDEIRDYVSRTLTAVENSLKTSKNGFIIYFWGPSFAQC